ncbi:MAG: IS110 family RNA-guided transposase [Ktedonobacterales bacterium]
MEIVYARCCGLDVHKRTVVACRIVPGAAGTPSKELRTFGTMTRDLLALADWLREASCTHVAMESTGVFWKPIYNLLEGQFEVLVVNAQHIKAVPGRKTDVRDAEWIADLLRHGLLRPSFIPDRPQRELRELTRYRTTLVQERATAVNRLQKVLEGANIKLASVATDVVGKSGREILLALVAGTSDGAALARLARGRLREKIPQLEQALTGQFGPHHRFLIAEQLAHIDFLDAALERVSAEIGARLRPFEQALQRLQTIPGVGRRTAEVLVAELGVDLTRFPSARHLASWAGLCPGHDESAGKRRSGRTRKGSPWLRKAVVEAAQAAAHTKDTYLAAQFHRLAARRGAKRAAVAVAHSILVIVYVLLTDQQDQYRDLGSQYFDERDRQAVQRRLVRRLEALGYTVSLEPTTPAA